MRDVGPSGDRAGPDLFGAAYPGAGVMDMLRYDKFSAGVAWVPDTCSVQRLHDVRVLHRYSPVHNVKPATVALRPLSPQPTTTDRVVPAHSFKFAAESKLLRPAPGPPYCASRNRHQPRYMPTDKRVARLPGRMGLHGVEHGDAKVGCALFDTAPAGSASSGALPEERPRRGARTRAQWTEATRHALHASHSCRPKIDQPDRLGPEAHEGQVGGESFALESGCEW